MGSPRSPGGRVIGNFRYQLSLNDGRLRPLTIGGTEGSLGSLPGEITQGPSVLTCVFQTSIPLRSPSRFFYSRRSPKDGLNRTRRILFLASQPGAQCLEELILASRKSRVRMNTEGGLTHDFKIVGTVTKPPKFVGRGCKVPKSNIVQEIAEKEGIPVFTPEKISDKGFMMKIKELKPDLCICVAYGKIFSKELLSIAPLGMLNIHASLLPKHRGASPVESCIVSGDKKTGVSVFQVVSEIDAGPILTQSEWALTGYEKASTLTLQLCLMGMRDLINALPSVWDGSAKYLDQKSEDSSYSGKVIRSKVSFCDFLSESATEVHRKVCAYPGTWAYFYWDDLHSPEKVKLTTTDVGGDGDTSRGSVMYGTGNPNSVQFCHSSNALELICADGSVLQILELQRLSKKRMDAKRFTVGIHNMSSLTWVPHDSPLLCSSTLKSSSKNSSSIPVDDVKR